MSVTEGVIILQSALEVLTDPRWRIFFEREFSKQGATILREQIEYRRAQGAIIYPPEAVTFAAFELTPVEKIQVVILGQDPYHGEGQAMGLAFSVPEGKKAPPSLRNIFKEVEMDIGKRRQSSGDLTNWAKQGVLLLNSVLTVERGKPGAHAKLGWETITDNIIRYISETCKNVVFLLWGAFAQSKRGLVNEDSHLVLSASHPSPFSAHRGFVGSKHFSKTNAYLQLHGLRAIQW